MYLKRHRVNLSGHSPFRYDVTSLVAELDVVEIRLYTWLFIKQSEVAPAQRQSIQTISCRFLSSCCSTVLRAMFFSQECFSLACLMFLLWILYYMKLFFTAVQVRQQQGNIQQQTLSATRQNPMRNEEPQNIEVITNANYPEEHDERQS